MNARIIKQKQSRHLNSADRYIFCGEIGVEFQFSSTIFIDPSDFRALLCWYSEM
jgi:hypothetical protein